MVTLELSLLLSARCAVEKSRIVSWIVPVVAGIFLVSAVLSVTEVSTTRAWGGTSFTASFADNPDVAVTSMGITKISTDVVAVGAVSPVEVAWESPGAQNQPQQEQLCLPFQAGGENGQ